MRSFVAVIGFVVGCTALASGAGATTLTQSVTFGPGLTDYNGATGTTSNSPSPTALAFFNSNLGTLTSVTFTYDYFINSNVTVKDTSRGPAEGTISTQSGAQFSSTNAAVNGVLDAIVDAYNDPVDGNQVTFGTHTLAPIAADVRGGRSTYVLAAGEKQTVSSNGSYTSTALVDSGASDLAVFSMAGGGLFTPTFTTLTGLVNSLSTGNTTAVQATTAHADLTILYTYTPSVAITEPPAMAVLGASLIMLGVLPRWLRRDPKAG